MHAPQPTNATAAEYAALPACIGQKFLQASLTPASLQALAMPPPEAPTAKYSAVSDPGNDNAELSRLLLLKSTTGPVGRDEVPSLENDLFAYPLPRANIVNDHFRSSTIPALLECMFTRTRNPCAGSALRSSRIGQSSVRNHPSRHRTFQLSRLAAHQGYRHLAAHDDEVCATPSKSGKRSASSATNAASSGRCRHLRKNPRPAVIHHAAHHSALDPPAAAAFAFVALRHSRPSALPAPSRATTLSPTPAAGPRQLTLSDGTVVRINTGGQVVEPFTAAERRVLPARGEAHFAVTKNPARPFFVRTGNIDVCAVGTAFDVNLRVAAVVVLVTEGKVSVSEVERVVPNALQRLAVKPLHLVANERAVVSLVATSSRTGEPAVVVSTAAADAISRTLAWQAPLLRLGGSALAELVLEFQCRSGQRVFLADPALASLRVGGRFRADDLEGCTHLLATTLDLDVDRAADGTLVLRQKAGTR